MAKQSSFIIGDIHGCYDELLALIDKAKTVEPEFQLYLTGDLINKGPKSFEVLQWVRVNQIPTVIGNHELKFIESCRNNEKLSSSLKKLKEQMGAELSDWLKWLEALPKYIETDDFILVHGGVAPGLSPEDTDKTVLANLRYWDIRKQKMTKDDRALPWHRLYNGEKPIVYGHWAMQGLHMNKNTIGLDTGCVYGKNLTGVFLPSRKLVQVKAARTYKDIH